MNDDVVENPEKLKVYAIPFNSEEGLAKQIAEVPNQSMVLRYRQEDKNRVLTKGGAYQQLGQSTSLFKGILEYSKRVIELSLETMPGAEDGCGCDWTVRITTPVHSKAKF